MKYIFSVMIALIGLFSAFEPPKNIEIYMNSENFNLDFVLSKKEELEVSKK
jgi:hypothetical protein